MRGRSLLPWLLRALSLAAMGLFFNVGFNVGSASAHQGHEHHHVAPAVAGTPWSGEASVTVVQAGAAIARAPCSDGQDCCRGDHCGCVMACHAALATLPGGPPAAAERPGLVLLDRSEPLAGLAGDRTERPPRPI